MISNNSTTKLQPKTGQITVIKEKISLNFRVNYYIWKKNWHGLRDSKKNKKERTVAYLPKSMVEHEIVGHIPSSLWCVNIWKRMNSFLHQQTYLSRDMKNYLSQFNYPDSFSYSDISQYGWSLLSPVFVTLWGSTINIIYYYVYLIFKIIIITAQWNHIIYKLFLS